MKTEVLAELWKIAEELEISSQKELREIFRDLSKIWEDEYQKIYLLRVEELERKLLNTAAQIQNTVYEMRWETVEEGKE